MGSHLGFRQVLALLATLLAAVLMVTAKGVLTDITANCVCWMLVATVTVALVSMATISCNYRSKYEGNKDDVRMVSSSSLGQLEHLLAEFALPMALFVFGGGSVMLRMFYVVADVQCMRYYTGQVPSNVTGLPQEEPHGHQDASSLVPRVVMNSATLAFCSLQIPFLKKLHGLRYVRVKYVLHHSLLLIAGADVCVWLYVFFQESHLIRLDQHGSVSALATHTVPLHAACRNYSSAMQRFNAGRLEHVLFPVTMEFMLASLEVLFHVWLLGPRGYTPLRQLEASEGRDEAGRVKEDLGEAEREGYEPVVDSGLHEDAEMQSSVTGHVRGRWRVQVYCGLLAAVCNVYTGLMFGLTEIVLLTYYILNSGDIDSLAEIPDNHTYMSKAEFAETVGMPVMVFRVSVSALPALWASVHCAWVLSSSKVTRPGQSRLTGHYVVLALAVGGVLVLSGFECVVCVLKLIKHGARPGYVVGLLEALLCGAPQYIIQAMVLYFGQRRLAPHNHRLYPSLQGALAFLAMFNFLHWAIDSFLESEFLSHRNELSTSADPESDTWRVLVHLFLPPVIYFRFISSTLLLRVKRLVREDGQAGAGVDRALVTFDLPRPSLGVSLSTQYGTMEN